MTLARATVTDGDDILALLDVVGARRLRPIIHGGGHEGGLKSGTLPVPLCVVFGVAACLLCDQISHDLYVIDANRDVFLQALAANVPDFKINGGAPRHSGHLNLRFAGIDAETLTTNLQPSYPLCRGALPQ